MDCHAITPNLYFGSKPEVGEYNNVDVIVLCAREYQPIGPLFQGVRVIHAPLDDDDSRPLQPSEIEIIVEACRKIAYYLSQDQVVLVTCLAGCNRSGLITAISAMIGYGWDAETTIQRLRAARSCALFNRVFEAFVRGIQLG
jgi:protein-tyrosine phosphatase